MPTDRNHLRKYSALLRQHINPPANECKIKVVAMVGRHNIPDMIGYVHKSRGEPGFVSFVQGYTDEQIEDGISSYTMQNQSCLKTRKNISVAGWAKVLTGYWEKNLHPWSGPPSVVMLIMIKSRLAYIGDAWCRYGNTLNMEKTSISMKSIFHPSQVTIADVEYAIFNKKLRVINDEDDFDAQEDFIAGPTFRDRTNDRVRYKFVVPSEDPSGNIPTDIVWTGAEGVEYTTEELLALAQEMRLGRAADLYGNTTTTPVQAAAGTDLGDDGVEAVEDSDDEEEGTSSTPGRDSVWT